MKAESTSPQYLLALTLLLGACDGDVLPPIYEQSEWLVLRSPPDEQICQGTFAAMEADVIALQENYGSTPVIVDYSWMPDSRYSTDQFPCQISTAFGCAASVDIYARTLASTHELVHAARRGKLPAVLEEGLATLFDAPIDADAGVMASREMLLEALEAGTWTLAPDSHGLYERLAHFVSFLFAQYGRETFREFEARVAWEDYAYRPLSQWKADFETVYAESFDHVWAAYANYPDCAPAQFHLPLTECSNLATAPASAKLVPAPMHEPGPKATFTRSLECSDDEVVGPIVSYDRSMTRSASYVVDIHNLFHDRVRIAWVGETADVDRAILTNCGNCWDGSAAFLSGSQTRTSAKLLSGPHALILYRELDAAGEFGIELGY
jgi:hypothetical protein